MDIRQLKTFSTVARELHVTKAAGQLGLAQPALTRQIRAMEHDLGCALVRKNGRGIALTAAGEYLYYEAQAILRSHEAMCLRTKAIGSGQAGHIRVGLSEAAAFEPKLARAFNVFRRKWPDVVLTFRQRQSVDLGVALVQEEVDLAFTCPIAATDPAFRVQTMATYTMVLAVPSATRFAHRRRLDLADLEGEDLVFVSHGSAPHSFEETLASACQKVGFTPNFIQTAPELVLAINLVAAGVGAAFVPDYMAGLRSDAVVYLDVTSPVPLELKLALLTYDRGWTPPSVSNLKVVARDSFRTTNVAS